jgi:hypothetical protein
MVFNLNITVLFLSPIQNQNYRCNVRLNHKIEWELEHTRLGMMLKHLKNERISLFLAFFLKSNASIALTIITDPMCINVRFIAYLISQWRSYSSFPTRPLLLLNTAEDFSWICTGHPIIRK